MMFLNNAAPFTALALGLLSAPLHAALLPATISSLSPSRVWERGMQGNLGNVGELVAAVKEYLQNENAYDPSVPGKCILYMTTQSGGNCAAYIQCDETDGEGTLLSPNPWNVCYVGGRQYLSDPRIGDFSITFTEGGGVNGNKVDGLHTPVLQLKNLNNWEPINIESVISQDEGSEGNLCEKGGLDADQIISWTCGIPMIGQAAFGMSNYNPVGSGGSSGGSSPSGSYAPGVCSAHVVQYQRKQFGVGAQYAFDVELFDANKKTVGLVQKQAVDPNTLKLDVNSLLPYVFIVTAGTADADDVTFGYAGQSWQCGNGKDFGNTCDLGKGPANGYENGDRKGDMSFNC